jgi:hypothetical protein
MLPAKSLRLTGSSLPNPLHWKHAGMRPAAPYPYKRSLDEAPIIWTRGKTDDAKIQLAYCPEPPLEYAKTHLDTNRFLLQYALADSAWREPAKISTIQR